MQIGSVSGAARAVAARMARAALPCLTLLGFAGSVSAETLVGPDIEQPDLPGLSRRQLELCLTQLLAEFGGILHRLRDLRTNAGLNGHEFDSRERIVVCVGAVEARPSRAPLGI